MGGRGEGEGAPMGSADGVDCMCLPGVAVAETSLLVDTLGAIWMFGCVPIAKDGVIVEWVGWSTRSTGQ